LPQAAMLRPHDGMSLVRLFGRSLARRHKPIVITYRHTWVLIDNEIKYLTSGVRVLNNSREAERFYNLSRGLKVASSTISQKHSDKHSDKHADKHTDRHTDRELERRANQSRVVASILGNDWETEDAYQRVLSHMKELWHFQERDRGGKDTTSRTNKTFHEGRTFHHVMLLRRQMAEVMASVNASRRGHDYPEGLVNKNSTFEPIIACDSEMYRPLLAQMLAKPQHRNELRHLKAANYSWWPSVFKEIDPDSPNLNKTRKRSRYEQLGGYLKITG